MKEDFQPSSAVQHDKIQDQLRSATASTDKGCISAICVYMTTN